MEISQSDLPIPNDIDVEEYRKGWVAYESYLSATENPHDPSSEAFQAWYRGWYDASQSEEHWYDTPEANE